MHLHMTVAQDMSDLDLRKVSTIEWLDWPYEGQSYDFLPSHITRFSHLKLSIYYIC